jgi:RNA polymerase sigma factor (sigma-70 family)
MDAMYGEAESAFRAFRERGRPRDLARVFDLTAQELLLVAGHLARGGVEAEELVQQTFLAALERRASWDATRTLVPWLLGILVRLARSERRRRAEERARSSGQVDALTSGAAGPMDRASDAELAEALGAALATLPDAYREVLTLRLVHGFEAVEIAHALGRPLETVKTQLKRGKERLRDALPRSLAALVTLEGDGLTAVRHAVLAAAQGTTAGVGLAAAGVGIMGNKALGAAVVLACAGTLWWIRPSESGGAADGESSPRLVSDGRAMAAELAPAAATASREEVAAADAQPLASAPARLVCRARWESDGTPAAGIGLWLWHTGQGRVPVNEFTWADDAGAAVFEGLPAGKAIVQADRGARSELVLASGENELEVLIPPGVLVTGVVLDDDEQPVADAELWLADPYFTSSSEGTWGARSGADGRFVLRDVQPRRAVAARARGRTPDEAVWVEGAVGEHIEVTLHVGASGPRLRGIVRDERGDPIEDAYLFVGRAIEPRILGRDGMRYSSPPPQCTSTDEEGHFEIDAVPMLDGLPLWVAAEGFATGYADLDREEAAAWLEITLPLAARVTGFVRDAEGLVLEHAEVSVVDARDPRPVSWISGPDWSWGKTWTISDGSFAVEALRPGLAEVRASVRGLGETRATLVLVAGETTTWEAEVLAGDVLAGSVVDERGEPIAGLEVSAACEDAILNPHRLVATSTDEGGRFRFGDAACARYTLHVGVKDSDLHAPLERRAVPAGTEALVIVLPASHRPSARLIGRLVAADGAPFTAESVRLMRTDANGAWRSGGSRSSCAEGRLETGLLPPGAYTVTVQGADPGAWTVGTFELAAGEVRDIGEHVRPEMGRLELELVDAAGASVPSGRFSMRGESDEMGMLLEFHGGRCVREGVQPGAYVLRSFGRELPMISMRLDVRAGETTRATVAFPVAFERWVQFPELRQTNVLECLHTWTCDGEELARGRWTFRALPEPQPPRKLLLPPGRHAVTFTGDDGRSETTTFDVSAATASPDLVVTIRAPFE